VEGGKLKNTNLAAVSDTVMYFNVDGMLGNYFTCTRYGTMTPGACARNYRDAPKFARSGRCGACIGCAVGVKHASDGNADAPVVPSTQSGSRRACLRCRRSGMDDASRLIGRMRLLRGQTLCISCYNREREVQQGKNAKGSAPRKLAGLFMTRVSYVLNGKAVNRESMTVPVCDRIEAALVTIRQTKAAGVFFAAPPVVRLSR